MDRGIAGKQIKEKNMSHEKDSATNIFQDNLITDKEQFQSFMSTKEVQISLKLIKPIIKCFYVIFFVYISLILLQVYNNVPINVTKIQCISLGLVIFIALSFLRYFVKSDKTGFEKTERILNSMDGMLGTMKNVINSIEIIIDHRLEKPNPAVKSKK
jgi:hypothetical protein